MVLAMVTMTACSKWTEQCQSAALAFGELDNAYLKMRTAAKRGQREAFQSARREFQTSTQKLAAVEVTGERMKAVALRREIEEAVQLAARVESECEAALTKKGADFYNALPTHSDFVATLSVGRKLDCN